MINLLVALRWVRANALRLLAMLIALFAATVAHASPSCHGKFPNFLTDICWSCTLPITIGSATIVKLGQEDTPNPGGMLCACTGPPRVGVKVGFWEPSRIAEVTRTPFCMVSLGGVELDPGFRAPRGARPVATAKVGSQKSSFYHAHWYTNPIWFFLQVMTDSPCLEEGSFDVAYLTEVDPLWNDDELTLILNPDVFLFANPIAQAVCAADCIAATTGFGRNELFWCAGCQGSLYPLNGHVQTHTGGVQASALIVQRLTAKMHREGLMFSASGAGGLCRYYPQPLMDKTNYKSQLIYPIPNTTKITGKCCQIGRAHV